MGLTWAPTKVGHPHQRACAVPLGSFGGVVQKHQLWVPKKSLCLYMSRKFEYPSH